MVPCRFCAHRHIREDRRSTRRKIHLLPPGKGRLLAGAVVRYAALGHSSTGRKTEQRARFARGASGTRERNPPHGRDGVRLVVRELRRGSAG